MIVIEQKGLGMIRYRRGYFSTPENIETLTNKLRVNDILRVYSDFGTSCDCPYLIYSQTALTVRIDLTKGLDAVLSGTDRLFHRGLRAAEKIRDRISIVTNTDQASTEFLRLYNSFARAKGGVPSLSPGRLRAYSKVSDICVLYLDDRPMSTLVTIKDRSSKCAINMFTASRRFENKADADLCGHLNRYLHWWEMQNCHSQGMEVHDLGFLYRDPSHPFNRFKLSFGGDVVSLHCYTFAGVGKLARLAVEGYSRLAASRLGGLFRHF